jgi:hypothetical protein
MFPPTGRLRSLVVRQSAAWSSERLADAAQLLGVGAVTFRAARNASTTGCGEGRPPAPTLGGTAAGGPAPPAAWCGTAPTAVRQMILPPGRASVAGTVR